MSENNSRRLNWYKYTWEEFENICYEYASEKYNSDIYEVEITAKHKDGGRDIIISNLVQNKIAWGECKRHKNSVGLKEIGKNVILAITNQIQKLIFFSVSSVTPNTKHEILRAAQIHNFDVLFLDGINLDREIAGNSQILYKYFCESFNFYNPRSDVLSADICIDEFENAYNDSFCKDTRYCKLENGLDFYVHFFLKNYHQSVVNNIRIELQDVEKCHFYETDIVIEKVNSFCDTVVTVRGILLNTEEVITLPDATITYIVKGKKQTFPIKLGELDGRNIWKVPLYGQKNLEFISSMKVLRDQVLNGYTRIIYLRGVSGSGKTRILKEISSVMIQKGFVSVYIDAMLHRKNYFFRELIRQILCLPCFNSSNMFTKQDFEKLLTKYHISFPDATSIHEYLWMEKKKSATLLGEFIYQCIIGSPVTSKLYIQIDNIQCLDEETQGSILFLCNSLLAKKNHVCLAFSLNIIEKKVSNRAPLIQYLENSRIHKEIPALFEYTIGELDADGRKSIVKNCLKLPITYEKEINEIADKAGALPLDILLFCKTLRNTNCFVWRNKTCEIEKPEEFSKQLSELSSNISSVIELRLATIDKIYSDKESVYKLFQLIIFFENKMPGRLVNTFNIDQHLVLSLKQDLVIAEHSDASITFFHDNYYRYFLKRGTVYQFDDKELLQLLHCSKEYEIILGPTMKINQAKCLYLLNRKDDFCKFAEELLDDFCASGRYQEIISLADFYLNKICTNDYKNQRLRFSIEKGLAQMETVSFVQGITTLKEIKADLEKDYFGYDLEIIGRFYHQYVNSYTHAGKYQLALETLQDFEKVSGLSIKYKFIIEDRYCLCYYSLGEVQLAEGHIQKALKLARKMGDDFWISTAYSDRAFIYLNNTNNISKTKRYFNKAIKYYHVENDNSVYRYIEIQIQAALSALLNHKYDSAASFSDNAINTAKERNYMYLLIPARNVKAFVLIMTKQFSKAIEVLKQARFESELFGSTKLIITLFNSLGVTYCAQKDLQTGYEYFIRAEKMLHEYSEPTDCVYRFAPLIANWMLATGQNISPELQDKLNYYSSQRLAKIFHHNIDDFSAIKLEEYFPLTFQGYALMY